MEQRIGETDLVLILDGGGGDRHAAELAAAVRELSAGLAAERAATRLTLAVPDDPPRFLEKRQRPDRVRPVSGADLKTGGVALFDTIGEAAGMMPDAQKAGRPRRRPLPDEHAAQAHKTVFVIVSGGADTASARYDAAETAELIAGFSAFRNWHFSYIGRGAHAQKLAAALGLSADAASNAAQKTALHPGGQLYDLSAIIGHYL
ncbi:MAG: hypothetical protein LBH24_03630 [Clostridiales bacterium]|jgi:hypothetical protein|nr:hypothetical protein [Clostridiales bacterium]